MVGLGGGSLEGVGVGGAWEVLRGGWGLGGREGKKEGCVLEFVRIFEKGCYVKACIFVSEWPCYLFL